MGNQEYVVHEFKRSERDAERSRHSSSVDDRDFAERNRIQFIGGRSLGKQPTKPIRESDLKPLPPQVLAARPMDQIFYAARRKQYEQAQRRRKRIELQNIGVDPDAERAISASKFKKNKESRIQVGSQIVKSGIREESKIREKSVNNSGIMPPPEKEQSFHLDEEEQKDNDIKLSRLPPQSKPEVNLTPIVIKESKLKNNPENKKNIERDNPRIQPKEEEEKFEMPIIREQNQAFDKRINKESAPKIYTENKFEANPSRNQPQFIRNQFSNERHHNAHPRKSENERPHNAPPQKNHPQVHINYSNPQQNQFNHTEIDYKARPQQVNQVNSNHGSYSLPQNQYQYSQEKVQNLEYQKTRVDSTSQYSYPLPYPNQNQINRGNHLSNTNAFPKAQNYQNRNQTGVPPSFTSNNQNFEGRVGVQNKPMTLSTSNQPKKGYKNAKNNTISQQQMLSRQKELANRKKNPDNNNNNNPNNNEKIQDSLCPCAIF